jgi:hypothetical protein
MTEAPRQPRIVPLLRPLPHAALSHSGRRTRGGAQVRANRGDVGKVGVYPRTEQGDAMRSTKAIHAVERLKTRSGNARYAAVSLPGGLFYLVDKADGTDQKRCEPLPLDEFVSFVDGLAPAKPRKASKLDVAFEAQIQKSRR